MSIIPRLLAGEATEAVDLAAVRTFLGSGRKKTARQVQNFANSAKRSDVGGDAGFEQMNAAQQREFISSSNTHAARKIRADEAVTSYRRDIKPTTIPRLLLGDRVGGAVDTTVNAARAAKQGVSDIGGALNEGGGIIFDAVKSDLKSGAESVAGFATHVGERVGGAAKSGLDSLGDVAKSGIDSIESVAERLGNPNTGVQGLVGRLVTEGPDAVRKAAGATMDAVSNNPVTRGLAGDTSGRAAAEAGQNFEQSYKNVFSSEATAEAFGVESSVLKDAFGKSGDEFAGVLKKGGLDEEGVKGLEAFRGEVKRVGDEGGQLSEEGMQSMLKNQSEIGNMYGGFSRAGATASPNALLRGMAGEGTGMESVMGIAAVAGLAGGANVAMGGDFTEGAAVGGLGALSVKGIAKGVAGSMGDIEGAMMKNILGDDMAEEGARRTIAAKGTTIKELANSGRGDLKVSDLGLPNKKSAGQTVDDLYTGSNNAGDLKTRTAIETDPLTGGQARRQNLTAIQKMSDDDERLKGFGKKKMRDMLNPNKEKNVAMNNRALVLGGGMLSGVAFTGNADRRDYRRGFNAHRGNRI